MRVDPKSLVRRLDALCRRALEEGVSLSVARTHYEVTVEHVLRCLIALVDGDLPLVLRHYEVQPGRLLAALDDVLEGMKTGNTGRPVFSPLLFTWIEDAYLLASVEQGQPEVRSGHLLLALLLRPGRSVLAGHTDELDKITPEALRRDLLRITSGSPEQARVTSAPGALGGPSTRRGVDAASEQALARFTTDLTARAAAGGIDPVLARDAEIRQMIDVLTRRMTVIPYRPLPPEVLRTIIELELGGIGRRMAAAHGLRLRVTDAAREAILSRCDDPSSGARNIDHVLDQAVLPRISEELLARMADGEAIDTLTLDAGQGHVLRFEFGRAGAAAVPTAVAPKAKRARSRKRGAEDAAPVAEPPAPVAKERRRAKKARIDVRQGAARAKA